MEEEFQAAIYDGGSWWMSPRTACNPSSCSSDIADMENLGPFWPKNFMNLNSNSSDDSSDGSMVFQDIQKPTDWNQNFVSGVQEAMNFSTTSDDGPVAPEIEAEHQVFTMDHQPSFNIASSFTGCTTFPTSSTPYGGYPLSLVQSLFINNSPPASPPLLPPLSQEQPLYDYQSNSKYISLTGNLTDNTAFKRPRLETPSPLPTFKVRKEKLGDRITALQQLVSPFGKTDTASVLHDAIEYIKLLHDQVNILSAPYMIGATKQAQPIHHKVKDEERHIQDLRSQGLCLVPVSGMFPVAPEMATSFWTPSYEGSFN